MTELEVTQTTDTVFVTRGEVEIQVTIYKKEPHEGYVRIWAGDGTMARTYPIRVIK